jgi:hypothetical protein
MNEKFENTIKEINEILKKYEVNFDISEWLSLYDNNNKNFIEIKTDKKSGLLEIMD